MDAFDDNKTNKEYYEELILSKNEILKLQKKLEIFEKKREAHRKICLDNSKKLSEILIFCEACNLDIKKSSLCNHNRSDKHKKNLQKLQQNNV